MEFKYRRAPATKKQIAKIDYAKDIRIQIVGKVTEKFSDLLVLEDDSGKVEIKAESSIIESLNLGETLRIFCRVLESKELVSELIQDMNHLDTELYKKTFFS